MGRKTQNQVISIQNCWERQPTHAVFPVPLGCIGMGLRPGTLPNQEARSPNSLCQAYHLVWQYLSLFLLNGSSSALLKHVHQCPWGTPLAFGPGSFCCKRAAGRPLPCTSFRGRVRAPLATRDWHTSRDLVSLYLFSVWVKHHSIQYLTARCFHWQLQHQDAMGRSVWSPPPRLVTDGSVLLPWVRQPVHGVLLHNNDTHGRLEAGTRLGW